LTFGVLRCIVGISLNNWVRRCIVAHAEIIIIALLIVFVGLEIGIAYGLNDANKTLKDIRDQVAIISGKQ